MKNENLHENMKEEARLLASETKRFQIISAQNPICREAAELLTSILSHLNTLERMTGEARQAMRTEAETESTTLDRQIKISPRASRLSAGERAKRQAVRRGATLVRGAF